jgi:hypothetical protein
VLYALKLGPIETGEGPVNAYLGFDDVGSLRPPILGRSDAAALRELAAGAPRGTPLRCEPVLAEAGQRLGFQPAPVPETLIPIRAALAVGFALGKLAERIRNPEVFYELARATAGYVQAAPWRYWNDETPIEVAISGSVSARFEAVVLGSGGETYGLALYADRGAAAEVAALVEAGRVREAALIESLSVTLDDKPAYVIRSLEAAFGVAAVPTPMRTGRAELELPSEQDVVALAAAMDAVAQLTPASLTATARLEVGAHRLQAEAHLPTSVVRGQEVATEQGRAKRSVSVRERAQIQEVPSTPG